MENIKIGRIVNAVALKGEVKVYNYSDYKERFEEIPSIIVDGKEEIIEKVRYQQETVILKLKGINDRNQAEAMKNKDVYITEADLRQLPEDTFYIKDLIGLQVFGIEKNQYIGTIKDVLQNTAQDIYVIENEKGREILVPAVSEFIKKVDLQTKKIEVKLLEGMNDEN